VGELRAHKFDKRNVSPFVLDQQVVAGAQALNSLIEPRNKFLVRAYFGLVRYGLNDAQDVLGAMIYFTHQQLLLVFGGSALRHVAHDRERHRFGKVLERVQHDVDRKRGAIRAPSYEVDACSHRPHARLRVVFGAMGDVTFSEVLRQQRFNWARDESSRLLPEHLAGLTIGIAYDAPLICHDDRIG
jgi:hypothetical protein